MKRLVNIIMTQSILVKLLFFGIATMLSLMFFSALGQLIAMVIYGLSALQDTLKFIQSDAHIIAVDTIPYYVVPIMYITQITSQIGLFVIPPLLFLYAGWKSHSDITGYFKKRPAMFSAIMAIALVFISLPLISWMSELNMRIPIRPSLVSADEKAGALTKLFFSSTETSRFVLNLIVVAVIPAIGEEFFFRGVIQGSLTRIIKNYHVAVIITALLFSFFHFQFLGFIPRFFLGLIFGYMMIWSGSIWLPVLAHFINNGSAVVVEFLSQRGIIALGYEDFGHYDSLLYQVVLSGVLTITILLLIRKHERADIFVQ